MNIEEVREYALSLNEQVTEELFVKSWISWRIAGKWFLLTNLDVPEPHVAVKMQPDVAIELRERYEGVGPAIHMNKGGVRDVDNIVEGTRTGANSI